MKMSHYQEMIENGEWSTTCDSYRHLHQRSELNMLSNLKSTSVRGVLLKAQHGGNVHLLLSGRVPLSFSAVTAPLA